MRVGIELSERCDVRGIEGIVTEVSVTGAIIKVRDSLTKVVIDVPNEEILGLEYL